MCEAPDPRCEVVLNNTKYGHAKFFMRADPTRPNMALTAWKANWVGKIGIGKKGIRK